MNGCFRRHCKQNSIASKRQTPLLSFVTHLSLLLCQSSKPVLLGRKKTSYSPSPPKVGKKPTLPKPAPDVDIIYLITFQNSQKKEGDVNFVKWVTAM